MSGSRKLTYSAGSWGLLLAVAGIIFIVNYLGDTAYSRLDITQNKQYTLSDSTLKLIGNLPDIVSIEVVISSNIPNPINLETQKVKDMIEEYRINSKGNIKVTYLDPVGKPEVQDQVRALGMNPIPIPLQGSDQASILNVWAYVYVQYRDNSELIPGTFRSDTLEYDLTSAIYRVTREQKTKVGFLNVDKRDIFKEYGNLKQVLEKEFEVDEVSKTSSGTPVDDSIKLLFVLNPYQVSDRDLFEIDQYIMRGGKAVFISDGARVFLQPGQYGSPMPVYAMALNDQMDTLGPLLDHYGVKRNHDLVMDEPAKIYPLWGPLGPKYPLWPQISMRPGKQVENPITQGLDHLTFAWASSLQIEDKLPEGVKAIPLVVTSPNSWAQGGNQLFVDPMKEPVPPLPVPGMGKQKRTLAVLLTGKFPSYFAGKPMPEPKLGDTAEPPPTPPAEPARADLSPDTDIMVIGCSYFIWDPAPLDSSDVSQNLSFMISAAEWMTGGNSLSDIKKRKVDLRPIEVTAGQSLAVHVIAPLAAPLGVIVFGVVWFSVNKSRKKKFLESV